MNANPPIRSVAVLPFVNMSSDPENEYFSDGITEEIINALTRIEGLQVTARTSSFAFKGQNKDVREIGRLLGVRTVLEGSVRKFGKRVRITAQLINVMDGYHLWSETFDRQLEDIFAIQDEISLNIAEYLREHMGHFCIDTPHMSIPTHNMEAYQLYLKARFYTNQWTIEAFQLAIDIYEEALELDPDFALPYAGLADLYGAMGALTMMPMDQASQKAQNYVSIALEKNPNLPECFVARANYLFWYKWEFKEAHFWLQKALEVSPGNAEARGFLGLYKAFAGEVSEGERLMKIALQQDPYSLQLHYGMCAIHQIQNDLEGVLREADEVLRLNPDFWQAKMMKGYVSYRRGQYDMALQYFEQLGEVPAVQVGRSGWKAVCYQRLGDLGKAEKYIAENLQHLVENPQIPCLAYTMVLYHMNAGDDNTAVKYLEDAIRKNASDFVFIHVDPTFKPLHNHPGFQKCVEIVYEKFPNHRPDEAQPARYAHSSLSEEDSLDINQRLLCFMEQEKPYLENNLNLRGLAQELDVNANYLSQVINEQHGKNFFEFINSYRVNELKEMMNDPDNRQFTLLSMAFDCGFNSKTTFNTAFKRITGLTPSQYLKKVG